MERGGGSTTSKPGTSPRVIAGAVSSNSIYPLEMTKREKNPVHRGSRQPDPRLSWSRRPPGHQGKSLFSSGGVKPIVRPRANRSFQSRIRDVFLSDRGVFLDEKQIGGKNPVTDRDESSCEIVPRHLEMGWELGNLSYEEGSYPGGARFRTARKMSSFLSK